MDAWSFTSFCEWTGLDPEDVLAEDAWRAFLGQHLPLAEWWADHQGEYV